MVIKNTRKLKELDLKTNKMKKLLLTFALAIFTGIAFSQTAVNISTENKSFPNDVNRNYVHLKADAPLQKTAVRLKDIEGKVILYNRKEIDQKSFDLSHIPAGLYFLHVEYAGDSVKVVEIRKDEKSNIYIR